MNIIKHVSVTLIIFSLAIMLSACGSKGDLYHPPEPGADQNGQEEAQKETNEETKKKVQ
ncbi:MAG: lipoprotein [Colwellia sp.]|nr:lipoprotein [Colwellia sp.]MCW8866321.1 lipoprotein [Colwellia sp.]MCW9080657.1 lipoprotein [Colwellia sp.]